MKHKKSAPPYEITKDILKLVAQISEKLGEVNANYLIKQAPQLRKNNRIKTIQSSLEIEGNTLTIDQVTAIFEKKRVLGPKKDVIEVENAIEVYEQLESFKANSLQSFLAAHKILLKGLIPNPGKIRTTNVGLQKGKEITHIAPAGSIVKGLLKELFDYLKKNDEPVLIKSCVFHYELEFIHPFVDGNGRMGRLWQSKILNEKYPIFSFLPIESVIKERQRDYYKVLRKCDKLGQSTLFIEFMLSIIKEELIKTAQITPQKSITVEDRIEIAKSSFGSKLFSRRDYLQLFKNISAPTASRDLSRAVSNNFLNRTGDKRLSEYRFK